MRVSVVIPVYNEAATIAIALSRVLASPLVTEVVIVDDCSTDGTAEQIARLPADSRVRLLCHPINQGKGAALRTGFRHVTGDVVIPQDADLEYDPAEYDRLLAPIADGRADAVFGSRFTGQGPHRVLYFWHYVGNRLLTVLSNALTNLNLTDMETCYKVVRRELLSSMVIEENRFGFEPELTAKLAALRCRIYEVGISYSGRTYAEGKKIGWKDGVRALYCIVKYNTWARARTAAVSVPWPHSP